MIAPLTAALTANPNLREVLLTMPSYRDELIPYAREQARQCGLPVEAWRQAVRILINHGLATYGPLFRESDGMPVGSSYWLTEQGLAAQHREGMNA